MDKRVKTLLLLLAGVCLTACAYSVETLKRDDSLRKQVMFDCAKMGIKAKDKTNCINAAKAQAELTGESVMDMFK